MRENRLTYRRKVSDVKSWRNFSIHHVAFALHRITGWALLGWVVVHLGLPLLGGSSVWNPLTELSAPLSEVIVIGLLAVLLFHLFNGIRLLAAELLGIGAGNAKYLFLGTVVTSALLVAGLGVVL